MTPGEVTILAALVILIILAIGWLASTYAWGWPPKGGSIWEYRRWQREQADKEEP